MTEFVKNQIVPLTITALSSDGNGIGHIDGMAVFVAGAVVGDELDVRLAKLCKSYAFGIIEQIRTPSPERIAADCAVCRSCGGCPGRCRGRSPFCGRCCAWRCSGNGACCSAAAWATA